MKKLLYQFVDLDGDALGLYLIPKEVPTEKVTEMLYEWYNDPNGLNYFEMDFENFAEEIHKITGVVRIFIDDVINA